MELELRENKKDLKYEREHNLSRLPLRMDFLVIKNISNIKIRNEIGDFFKKYNIFEYKSPGDTINYATLCKVLAYAYLYMSEISPFDTFHDSDITISIVREERPAKLLKLLKNRYAITKNPMAFIV